MRGLSDEYGSWNTICALRRRRPRDFSASGSPSRVRVAVRTGTTTENAMSATRLEGYVDTSRLYATGVSGGGVLSAWIVGHNNRFAAAETRHGHRIAVLANASSREDVVRAVDAGAEGIVRVDEREPELVLADGRGVAAPADPRQLFQQRLEAMYRKGLVDGGMQERVRQIGRAHV